MEHDRMLTVDEAAEQLRANPQTIRRWLRERKLRGVMPGGKKLGYRIPETEIRRLLGMDADSKIAA
jgi:excisionase family DNA binding protein